MIVVESEIASGIAHPFIAYGFFDYEQELMS